MDEETTAALLNFSYHLACGNTDEAYKSVTWWPCRPRAPGGRTVVRNAGEIPWEYAEYPDGPWGWKQVAYKS